MTNLKDIQERIVGELNSKLKVLGFAISAYENAKQMHRENESRPLEERTEISKLTALQAQSHELNINNAYEDIVELVRTALDRQAKAISEWVEGEKLGSDTKNGFFVGADGARRTKEWNAALQSVQDFLSTRDSK